MLGQAPEGYGMGRGIPNRLEGLGCVVSAGSAAGSPRPEMNFAHLNLTLPQNASETLR